MVFNHIFYNNFVLAVLTCLLYITFLHISGLHPDEITQVVKLPPHLQEHPYLQEFYGTVEWSSKAVFSQYMGWFSGSVAELHPLSPKVFNEY